MRNPVPDRVLRPTFFLWWWQKDQSVSSASMGNCWAVTFSVFRRGWYLRTVTRGDRRGSDEEVHGRWSNDSKQWKIRDGTLQRKSGKLSHLKDGLDEQRKWPEVYAWTTYSPWTYCNERKSTIDLKASTLGNVEPHTSQVALPALPNTSSPYSQAAVPLQLSYSSRWSHTHINLWQWPGSSWNCSGIWIVHKGRAD